MPIYAYRCAACGHAKDVLQKMSDPVLSVCPACGAAAFTKQLTAAGFQLKGSGWYVTDFRGDGKGRPAKDDAGDGAEADGAKADGAAATAASSGDAKPASADKAGTADKPGAAAEAKPAAKADAAAPAAPAAAKPASGPAPASGS